MITIAKLRAAARNAKTNAVRVGGLTVRAEKTGDAISYKNRAPRWVYGYAVRYMGDNGRERTALGLMNAEEYLRALQADSVIIEVK